MSYRNKIEKNVNQIQIETIKESASIIKAIKKKVNDNINSKFNNNKHINYNKKYAIDNISIPRFTTTSAYLLILTSITHHLPYHKTKYRLTRNETVYRIFLQCRIFLDDIREDLVKIINEEKLWGMAGCLLVRERMYFYRRLEKNKVTIFEERRYDGGENDENKNVIDNTVPIYNINPSSDSFHTSRYFDIHDDELKALKDENAFDYLCVIERRRSKKFSFDDLEGFLVSDEERVLEKSLTILNDMMDRRECDKCQHSKVSEGCQCDKTDDIFSKRANFNKILLGVIHRRGNLDKISLHCLKLLRQKTVTSSENEDCNFHDKSFSNSIATCHSSTLDSPSFPISSLNDLIYSSPLSFLIHIPLTFTPSTHTLLELFRVKDWSVKLYDGRTLEELMFSFAGQFEVDDVLVMVDEGMTEYGYGLVKEIEGEWTQDKRGERNNDNEILNNNSIHGNDSVNSNNTIDKSYAMNYKIFVAICIKVSNLPHFTDCHYLLQCLKDSKRLHLLDEWKENKKMERLMLRAYPLFIHDKGYGYEWYDELMKRMKEVWKGECLLVKNYYETAKK